MHKPKQKISFDFDEWQHLARSSPAAFEIKRHETIAHYLEQLSPEQKSRLEKLQWRIDMEIKRSATPLSALFKIYDMMMSSLHQQKAVLDNILDNSSVTAHQSKAAPGSTVIELKRPLQS